MTDMLTPDRQSLFFPEITSRQEQIPDAYKHTYEWIFEDIGWEDNVHSKTPHKWANFAHWLRSEGSGMYWIHGKAGSGKSTLMSFVVQDSRTGAILKKWAGHNSTLLTPSFFFWESGTLMQRSVQGLLQSFLYQLLGAFRETLGLTEIAPQGILYSNQFTEGAALDSLHIWTQRQLTTALSKVLNAVINTGTYFCFFIDGLDEFEGDADALRDITTTLCSYENTKVCASSRPEPAFIHFFATCPQLRLQDLTRNDIASYVRDRLSRDLPNPEVPLALSLIGQIVSKASGVFLWVRIVVQNILSGLRNGNTISELQRSLDDVPQGLEELYTHMLATVSKQYLSETQLYFEILFADQTRSVPMSLTV